MASVWPPDDGAASRRPSPTASRSPDANSTTADGRCDDGGAVASRADESVFADSGFTAARRNAGIPDEDRLALPPRRSKPSRRLPYPVVGLRNAGNRCYLNALIQAVYAEGEWVARIAARVGEVVEGLAKREPWKLPPKRDCNELIFLKRLRVVFAQMNAARNANHGDRPAVDDLHEALGNVNPHFSGDSQQDAHEVLCTVIDALKTATRLLATAMDANAEVGGDDVSGGCPCEIVTGVVQVTTWCRNCETSFVRDEPFQFLSVPVADGLSPDLDDITCPSRSPLPPRPPPTPGTWSLLDCVDEWEMLDGGEKYECGRCATKQEARQRRRVVEAPAILVLHLKVFRAAMDSQSGSFFYAKITGSFRPPGFVPIGDVIRPPDTVEPGQDGSTGVARRVVKPLVDGMRKDAIFNTASRKRETPSYGGKFNREVGESRDDRENAQSTVIIESPHSLLTTVRDQDADSTSAGVVVKEATIGGSDSGLQLFYIANNASCINGGSVTEDMPIKHEADDCDQCSATKQPRLAASIAPQSPITKATRTLDMQIAGGVATEQKTITTPGKECVKVNELISADEDGYDLYAMVVHQGTRLNSGHYYCLRRYEGTKCTGKWLKCDDLRITAVELDCELDSPYATPYLLFYRRRSRQDPSEERQSEK